MNFENLLSYQQLVSAIASADINVAHCAATGLAVDLYILDNCKFEVDDRVIDVLNIFTQTSEIVFRDFSYVFAQDDVVDSVEQKLLRLFQALRRNRFSAIELFENEEFIGFRGRFDMILKARKIGE
jgi:hypothetical protein